MVQWILVLTFLSAASFLVTKNATDFQASVIPTKQAPAYDGLVMPVQRSPIWTSLTADQYKADYNAIPSDKMQTIPVYDANVLKTPVEQLGWKTASDLAIRNAKITYSVPYMGNYKLDGVENGGSHLAVDIKVPSSTPVYAIGNGVVVKVSNISSGFGTHIVVRHDNFPSYDNQSVLTTYYSSYNHLGQALVSEGDVVLKGQQIALSGNTGDSTTPHVHFQIDNTNAPWHPYWHFTYKEASAAGYNFTTAINAGFNKDKALATTINPVMYIQKYAGVNGVSSPSPAPTPAPAPAPEPATVTTPAPEPQPIVTPPVVETQPAAVTTPAAPVTVTRPAVSLQVLTDKSFIVGDEQTITVKALDASGNTTPDYQPLNGLSLRVENGTASLEKTMFLASEIHDGTATTKFKANGPQGLRFQASDGDLTGHSDLLQSSVFSDVDSGSTTLTALQFLKDHDVIGGYPDGTFRPRNVVSRVEALKFILKGVNKNLVVAGRLPFKDTSVNQWYANYVATAFNSSIVGGYPDQTFKPGNTVNRAEFLKMLLAATDVKLEGNVSEDVFSDVSKTAWYAPYVKYAKDKNLIDANSSFFKPEEGMTRSEVAEIIYRTIVLKLTGEERFSTGLVVSGSAADEFFRNAS